MGARRATNKNQLIGLVSLLQVIYVPSFVYAQLTSDATCPSTFALGNNSLGQTPCLVFAQLSSVCNAGVWDVPALAAGLHYSGPRVGQENACQCSMAVYNLAAACSLCQDQPPIKWSRWNTNCTADLLTVGYHQPIPASTTVPAWAFLDVTQVDQFDVLEALPFLGQPDIGPSVNGSFPTASIALPTSTAAASGPAGGPPLAPLIGGIVGGVCALAALIFVFFFLRQRRKAAQTPPSEQWRSGSAMSHRKGGGKGGGGVNGSGAYSFFGGQMGGDPAIIRHQPSDKSLSTSPSMHGIPMVQRQDTDPERGFPALVAPRMVITRASDAYDEMSTYSQRISRMDFAEDVLYQQELQTPPADTMPSPHQAFREAYEPHSPQDDFESPVALEHMHPHQHQVDHNAEYHQDHYVGRPESGDYEAQSDTEDNNVPPSNGRRTSRDFGVAF